MGETIIWVAAIVVGIPVICVFGVGAVAILSHWRLKAHEMKVQEKKLAIEHELRSDELNAKLLRMDDFGLSPVEIASLVEDVRRLREEVAALRHEMSSRASGQSAQGGT
jgi:hypothetical protein